MIKFTMASQIVNLLIWAQSICAHFNDHLSLSPKLICYQVKSLQILSSTICKSNCCFSFNHGAVNLELLLGSWFIKVPGNA